jgi:hypothetical protein
MGASKQNTLDVITQVDRTREKECIDFLVDRGYIVTPPVKNIHNITKIQDLVEFFYTNMHRYNPSRKLRYVPIKEDRVVLSNFVKTRMKISCIKRKDAIRECVLIIDTLFKNESKFNLMKPITTPVILYQGWLIARVTSIINSEDKDAQQEFFSKIDELIDNLVDDEEFQDKIQSELDVMHNKFKE